MKAATLYDTIEWILENIPNHNGRVGQWGISYPGWQTVMGMIDAHPALKALSARLLRQICGLETIFITMAHFD